MIILRDEFLLLTRLCSRSQRLAIGTGGVLNFGRNAPEPPQFRSSYTRQECRRMQRRRMVGLTGFRGERAPAAVAVEEDVVAELLVLLR